jgi:hypothetical protein
MAMCAAVPPKLMHPSRNQLCTASDRHGGVDALAWFSIFFVTTKTL